MSVMKRLWKRVKAETTTATNAPTPSEDRGQPVAVVVTAVDRLGWKPKTYERWLADLTERETFGETA